MRLLIIADVGHGHALAFSLAKSSIVKSVTIIGGNAGTLREPKCDALVVNDPKDLDGWLANHTCDYCLWAARSPQLAPLYAILMTRGVPTFGLSLTLAAQLPQTPLAWHDWLDSQAIAQQPLWQGGSLLAGPMPTGTVFQWRQGSLPRPVSAGEIAIWGSHVQKPSMQNAWCWESEHSPYFFHYWLDGADAKLIEVTSTLHAPKTGKIHAVTQVALSQPLLDELTHQHIGPVLQKCFSLSGAYCGPVTIGLLPSRDLQGWHICFMEFGWPDLLADVVVYQIVEGILPLVSKAPTSPLATIELSYFEGNAVSVPMYHMAYEQASDADEALVSINDLHLSMHQKLCHHHSRLHLGRVSTFGHHVVSFVARDATTAQAFAGLKRNLQRLAWDGCWYQLPLTDDSPQVETTDALS